MKRLSSFRDVKFCLKKTTFLMISVLILTGCEAKKEPPIKENIAATKSQETLTHLGLESKLENVNVVIPSCSEKHCPQINIQRLESNYAVVDELVDQYVTNYIAKLVQGFNFNTETTDLDDNNAVAKQPDPTEQKKLAPNQLLIQQIQPSIDKFIQLSDEVKSLGSSAPLTLYIKPQVLNPQGPIVTIVLNASHYIGGAHGSTSQQYINFILDEKRPLNLNMLIKPDKRKNFNDLVYQSFQKWVTDLQPDIALKTYEELWTFKVSENFYLGPKSLILQYGEYEIGPYAVGLPRLEIPYEELTEILEKKYLPAAMIEQPETSLPEDQVKAPS